VEHVDPGHHRAGRTVPILLYHAITDSPGALIAPFAVSPREFRAHLDLLLNLGYRCIRISDLDRPETWHDGGSSAAGRIVALTFDDGYADYATAALPELTARAMPSTLYVTTGWLCDAERREPGPTDAMLSWKQLPDLVEQDVEIGAHSHSHPELDTLSVRRLRSELHLPKQLLEDALGAPVDGFAYPHGYNGPRVRRLTAEAGYASAVSVHNARHHKGENAYDRSRLIVTNRMTLDELARWLEGPDDRLRTGDSLATRGWRAYRRGKALLRGRPGSAYS
jgi:peptidoglycan/xylan/chitin deacetylase (PgdA/CDA1 family)